MRDRILPIWNVLLLSLALIAVGFLAIGQSIPAAWAGMASLCCGTVGLWLNLLREREIRLSAEEALARTAAIADLLGQNASDVILRVNMRGVISYASPATARYCGHDQSGQLVGTPFLSLITDGCREEVAALQVTALSGVSDNRWHEVRANPKLRGPTGEGGWFDIRLKPLIDGSGFCEGTVAILRNVDERKTFEQRLAEAGTTDPLTGLANRPAFLARLQLHLDGQGGGYIAMFDLDHFKQINDNFGQDVGDKVLILFANLARTHVRGGDVVARLGGEMFGVLLPLASSDQAEAVCERILRGFSDQARAVGDAIVRTSASGGIARIVDSTDAVMREAEIALYTAKAKGRDRLELAMRRSQPGARW